MIELIARKGGIQIDGIGGIEINIFAVGNKYCWTVRRAAGRGGGGRVCSGECRVYWLLANRSSRVIDLSGWQLKLGDAEEECMSFLA